MGRDTVVNQRSCPKKRIVITSRVISQLQPAQIRTCKAEALEALKEGTETVKEVIATKVAVAVATEIGAQAVVAEVEISVKAAVIEAAMELLVEVSPKDPR